jgi:hypothetical protein
MDLIEESVDSIIEFIITNFPNLLEKASSLQPLSVFLDNYLKDCNNHFSLSKLALETLDNCNSLENKCWEEKKVVSSTSVKCDKCNKICKYQFSYNIFKFNQNNFDLLCNSYDDLRKIIEFDLNKTKVFLIFFFFLFIFMFIFIFILISLIYFSL